MKDKELRDSVATSALLTTPPAADRLLAIMARWWEGWSLTRIGREQGLSRQRVAALLAQVGCTRALWRRADHGRPDSRRRATAGRVTAAGQALAHPRSSRLTVGQRAALAWQAQGLVLVDIARRMRTSPQNVLHLQVAGRWRLDRFSKPKRRGARPRLAAYAEPEPRPLSDAEIPALAWDDLLPSLGRAGTKHDAAAGEGA